MTDSNPGSDEHFKDYAAAHSEAVCATEELLAELDSHDSSWVLYATPEQIRNLNALAQFGIGALSRVVITTEKLLASNPSKSNENLV